MNNTMVNETLAERTAFIIPKVSDSKFSSAELADDMDGLQLSFQRAKIPGGGVLQFELPGEDPENPDYVQTLEGVILFNHSANSYWPAGSEYDDNTPPQCQSVDGKVGYGDPGGICEACDYNKFGSDPNGGGKACKNMRVLYLLRSGEMMPIQLSLPPTSIRPYTTFVNSAFLLRGRRVCSGLVQIGLRKGSSNGSPTVWRPSRSCVTLRVRNWPRSVPMPIPSTTRSSRPSRSVPVRMRLRPATASKESRLPG